MATTEKEEPIMPQADNKKLPTVILVVGMAGSGKSTFMQRLNAHLRQGEDGKNVFSMNFDPAVGNVNFPCNMDIRDTVDYKQVMKQYDLGPNGAIMTSLNLFATRFDQVISLIDSKENLDYVLVDTPGQIEAFTWSASGSVITDSLAQKYPTVMCFIMDTPRSANPVTFMSNMMYACSIMYKAQVPFLVVFNKTDVMSGDFAKEWMTDFEALEAALSQDKTYMASLTKSMSLVMEEFYRAIDTVSLSSLTGLGVDDFVEAVVKGRAEYWAEYKPHLDKKIAKAAELRERTRQVQLAKIQAEAKQSKGQRDVLANDIDPNAIQDDFQTDVDAEEDRREYERFVAELAAERKKQAAQGGGKSE